MVYLILNTKPWSIFNWDTLFSRVEKNIMRFFKIHTTILKIRKYSFKLWKMVILQNQLSLGTRLNRDFGGCASAIQTLPICDADAILTSRLEKKKIKNMCIYIIWWQISTKIIKLWALSWFLIPTILKATLNQKSCKNKSLYL